VSDNTSAEPFKDHCGEVRKIKAEDLMSSDKIERWIDTECFMRPGRTFVFRIMPGSPGITRRPGPYEGELMFPSIKPMTIMGWIGRTNYVTEFENNMKFTSEEVAKEGGPEYGPIRVTVNILEKKPGDIPADSERRDLRGEIWYRIEVS
jgi:hypothetical protein